MCSQVRVTVRSQSSALHFGALGPTPSVLSEWLRQSALDPLAESTRRVWATSVAAIDTQTDARSLCQAVLAAIWAAIAREEGRTILPMLGVLSEHPFAAQCDAHVPAGGLGSAFGSLSDECDTRLTLLAILLAQHRLDEAACHAVWLAQFDCAQPAVAPARRPTHSQHTNRSTLHMFSIDIHTGVVAEVCHAQCMICARFRRFNSCSQRQLLPSGDLTLLKVIDRLSRLPEFALSAISNNFFPKCRHYANCASDLEVVPSAVLLAELQPT